MAYTPFPTFSSPEGGGITAVQMPASQMRFPTPNFNPRQREPEPTTLETIAPFMPLVTEGIMGLFEDEPERMSADEYLTSIGEEGFREAEEGAPLLLQDVLHNRRQEALANAYALYGGREEADGFGLDEIANLVVASGMGRGADDYARTYSDIRKAREAARLAQATNRTTYLNKSLEEVDNLQSKVYEDANAAAVGVPDVRPAFVDPRGEVYVMNDDKTGYANIRDLEGNWIEQRHVPTEPLSKTLRSDRQVQLDELDVEAVAGDQALLATLELSNEVIYAFDRGIADPVNNPISAATAFANMGNSLTANLDTIYSYMTFGDQSDSGEGARRIFEALQSGSREALENALSRFENDNQDLTTSTGKSINFRDLLGDAAYGNVRTRGAMLQLAYMAAAANGQTGRTLSDRDLAYHLDMVGFGSTDSPQTAKDNLLGFVDSIIRQHDNRTQGGLSLNRIASGYFPVINRQTGKEDPAYTSTLSSYWIPPTIKNEEGQLVHDWSSTEMGNWEYRRFLERYRYMPAVQRWAGEDLQSGHIRPENAYDPFRSAPGGNIGTGGATTPQQLIDSEFDDLGNIAIP